MDNNLSIIGQAPEGYDGVGYLIVRVFTARGAIPIGGALVTISYADASQPSPYAVLTTDKSGRTPKIALPAPPIALSLSPSQSQSPSDGIAGDTTLYQHREPYALYNVQIAREGFYVVNDLNVRVFAGITAIQDADLVPRSESLPQPYYSDDSVFIDGGEESGL